MIDTLARLGRWLISGRSAPVVERIACDFCERGHHVHDVNTGACITAWCQCEVPR